MTRGWPKGDDVEVQDLEGLLTNIVAERTREQPWLFDDALQEARIGAWQRLEEGKSPGIAVHKARQAAMDVVRGRRMTGSKASQGGDSASRVNTFAMADSISRVGSDGEEWELELKSLVDTAYRQLVEVEERAMLRTALKVLGAREQRIVWMRFYEGLPPREIGEREGITRQRVEQILKAAYPKMRAALEEDS